MGAPRNQERDHGRELGVGSAALERLVVEHELRVLAWVGVNLLRGRLEGTGGHGVDPHPEFAELTGESTRE